MSYRERQIRQVSKHNISKLVQRWNSDWSACQAELAEAREKESKLNKTIQALTILANQRKEDLAREKEALLALAKQKIEKKQEWQELLTNLEARFNKDKEELEQGFQEITIEKDNQIRALKLDKEDLLKVNQEFSQKIQKQQEMIEETNEKLNTVITAIEGNTLGKDWKKLILGYIKGIQSSLVPQERERERERAN